MDGVKDLGIWAGIIEYMAKTFHIHVCAWLCICRNMKASKEHPLNISRRGLPRMETWTFC